MKESLLKFENWLLVNGKSHSTTINYISRVNKFLEAIEDIDNISEENISAFLLDLQTKTNKNETINSYRNAILAFVRFLKKDITVPKLLKVDFVERKVITINQLEDEIIPIVETIDFKHRHKWRAILYFLFFTGMRVSELVSLKRENINFKNLTVKIYEKKKKRERIVCFTKRVAKIIELYFITESEKKNAFNTSYDSIVYLLKKINVHFKDVHLHCHIFRHGYATHLIKQGVGIEKVSKLLGHSNVITTMKYLKLDISVAQKEYNKYIK